jgi:hypothetical protein
MPFTRIQRRFTAWLAMLAMVLAAFAPTLAQAVAASTDRGDWVQVCSASGMFWVKTDGAGLDASSPSAEGLPMADIGMQCPWCLLHSPAVAPPPVSALLATVANPVQLPARATAAPPPAGLWIAAPARAPPRLA